MEWQGVLCLVNVTGGNKPKWSEGAEVIGGDSTGRSKVTGEKGKGHHQMRSQDNERLDDGTERINLWDDQQSAACWLLLWYGGGGVGGWWKRWARTCFSEPQRARWNQTGSQQLFQSGNGLEADEVLLGWTVCWCSGCAAWTETQPCRSRACGSSSGHPCTSPAPGAGWQNEQLSLCNWSMV